MPTETVTKTVILPLQTSQRKNERVAKTIDEWQRIADHLADVHPSFPSREWGRTKQNPQFYRAVKREFPDVDIHSAGKVAVVHKVGESFSSWDSNGRDGERPQFGDGDYCRFTNQGIELESNGSGYGVKVKLEPYDAEWFGINASEYHREYLDGVVNGDMKLGSGELHLNDGSLSLHLSVSQDVSVVEWDDVERTVGVDLGERVMWCSAVCDANGSVERVEMEPGREYRHTRERLKRKRERFMENGKVRKVKQSKNQYYDYTDHITHVASRSIVDLAKEHDNSGIVLEDLTHYRETATDAIHDWPYAELQEKIMYKATDAGIPVKKIDPKNTSVTCRKCGHESHANRHGVEFECASCGYEVHADVNAAINIAQTSQ